MDERYKIIVTLAYESFEFEIHGFNRQKSDRIILIDNRNKDLIKLISWFETNFSEKQSWERLSALIQQEHSPYQKRCELYPAWSYYYHAVEKNVFRYKLID